VVVFIKVRSAVCSVKGALITTHLHLVVTLVVKPAVCPIRRRWLR
jgi:hypothetical protein